MTEFGGRATAGQHVVSTAAGQPTICSLEDTSSEHFLNDFRRTLTVY